VIQGRHRQINTAQSHLNKKLEKGKPTETEENGGYQELRGVGEVGETMVKGHKI
jgi:hypothetical protein